MATVCQVNAASNEPRVPEGSQLAVAWGVKRSSATPAEAAPTQLGITLRANPSTRVPFYRNAAVIPGGSVAMRAIGVAHNHKAAIRPVRHDGNVQ